MSSQRPAEKVDVHSIMSDAKPEPLPEYLDETQLDNQAILRIIQDIQSSSPNKEARKDVYSKKYSDFAERYPVLFEMACCVGFDYDKFNFMMEIRGQIVHKQRTVENASAEIGTKFYNMYHGSDASHPKSQ